MLLAYRDYVINFYKTKHSLSTPDSLEFQEVKLFTDIHGRHKLQSN